ncbi:hypothetical protein BASA50_007739 [Batrachochytrium salamandrivorans]|uniref:RxLR effector candidate protein n=1 Tax=Batrachochytrium salamandrivorans TaxID=1357716 RepID=A0ABQ8F637_9FUNG|nr:hypothetical protein BASA50_007739 [Batrachochytrium salamandrivorans]KAH9247698.1 hypothetical protein BASA81_014688 [Batrachochytrium salamandrivorans]KAH9270182.1 hypothetical protein BASA83_007701 [Batrachochytrium salamandrivorans]
MRVDIGIVLSVLSFSALAKVIPNDDSHGLLLVRRAVGPDTTDLLWKRADGDDEQGSSPMDSTTGADVKAVTEAGNNAEAEAGASSSDSSPDHPSGSDELSELDQTSDSTEELYRPSQKQLLTQRPKYMPRSDKESIQKAVEKVTEAFEGERANRVISEIKAFLTYALSSAKRSLAAYNSQTSALFFLFIPKGDTDQQSLTKEMHGIQKSRETTIEEILELHKSGEATIEEMIDIQKSGKYVVKEHFDMVKDAIYRIIQNPQNVMKELRSIEWWTIYMRNFIRFLNDSQYMALFSKVRIPENEVYVEVTKAYVFQIESDWKLASKLLAKIEGMIDGGSMRPRTMSSKVSSLMSNVKNRLGIHDGPPADTTTD